MITKIKDSPTIKLICIKGIIRTGTQVTRQIIPSLWSELKTLDESIPRMDTNRYALIVGDLPGQEHEICHYYAGIRIPTEFAKPLPNNFFYHEIPPGLVATTLHTGSPMAMGQTAHHLLNEWLPTTHYTLRLNQELIVYPPDYDKENPQAQCEYSVFLKT